MTPSNNPFSREAFDYAANESRSFFAGFVVMHVARILVVGALLAAAYLSVH